MKSKVHQALCNVVNFNFRRLIKHAAVNDELMRATTILVHKHNFVIIVHALGHVIGGKNGNLSRLAQTIRAHERNVHPRNWKNAGAAIWSRRHWTN